MQGFFARVLLVLLALAGPVSAQDIVLGMSKNEIGITAFFNGSEILIFGALKHETAASSAGDLDVVVTIATHWNNNFGRYWNCRTRSARDSKVTS